MIGNEMITQESSCLVSSDPDTVLSHCIRIGSFGVDKHRKPGIISSKIDLPDPELVEFLTCILVSNIHAYQRIFSFRIVQPQGGNSSIKGSHIRCWLNRNPLANDIIWCY